MCVVWLTVWTVYQLYKLKMQETLDSLSAWCDMRPRETLSLGGGEERGVEVIIPSCCSWHSEKVCCSPFCSGAPISDAPNHETQNDL